MEASSAELPQAVPTGYEIPHAAAAAAGVLPGYPMGHAAVGSGILPGAALSAATPLTPLQALQQGNLGVGFSGTGFLLMYFVGVTSILRSLGIVSSTTRVAGASGGSVTSAMMCSNVTNAQFAGVAKSLATTCALTIPANCQYSLDLVARTGLGIYLPANVATRCQGRLFAAVTQANPNTVGLQPTTDTGVLVQNFTDKGQVINALAASSYIPRFSGTTAVTFPGNITNSTGAAITAAYDGVFTNPLPVPPLTGGYVITVSALVNTTNATNPPNFDAQLLPLANNVAAQALDVPPYRSYNPLNPVKQPQPAPVDIYPGRGGALSFTAAVWNSFTTTAPSVANLQILYDQGRRDAAAWCGAQGMATAAAINTALTTTTVLDITALPFYNLSTALSG